MNRNNIWNEKCEIVGQIINKNNITKIYLYDEPIHWDKKLSVKKMV